MCVCVCAPSWLCPTLCSSTDCSPPIPLSMEFFRQEYFCGLPFPTPRDLPKPGIDLYLFHLLHWHHFATWKAPGREIPIPNTTFKRYMIKQVSSNMTKYHEMMIHHEMMIVKIIECYENPNKDRCEPSVNKLINVY